MSDELTALEHELTKLVAERRRIVRDAEAVIRNANREFDKKALPLGRRINALRAELDDSEPEVIGVKEAPKASASSSPKASTSSNGRIHDPDWSDEDIDHYYELMRRVK